MRKSVRTIGGCVAALLLHTQVAYADMKTLADNVYMHFSNGYSSLVVVGDNGVLVVDPASTDRAKAMKSEIANITDKKVTHVVLTHEHYDHVGGTEVFAGAEIVCHVICQKVFDLDVLGVAPKKVTQSFEDRLTIDLGSTTVELLHIGTGDGLATTIVSVPSAKVVATADLYDPRSFVNGMFIDDRNYLGVRKILNEISGWNITHSISGHSDSTDPNALREYAELVNKLYTAVREELDKAMAEGGPRAAFGLLLGGELTRKIKLPKYKDSTVRTVFQRGSRMRVSIL